MKGPFDLDMIEAFILSGHYPPGVQICAEDSNQWKSHSVEVRGVPPPLPQQSTQPVGSKPSGGIPKWMLWTGGIIGVWILTKVFSSSETTADSARTTYSAAASPGTGMEDKAPLPGTYNSTLAPRSSPDDVLYKDLQGRTFRVPHSDYLRLSKKRDALTVEDSSISAAQSQLAIAKSRLEQRRLYLDRTNQSAIDEYNEEVDQFNIAHAQLTERLGTFNQRIDSFNAELARVGTRIP